MPKVTGAHTTYNTIGNREDLSDVIYNIDPFDTPIMSSIGRRNITNRTFDWQTANLPAVDLNNAMDEGFTAPASSVVVTARPTNVTQIFAKTATVAGSNEKVKSAGRKSEMAFQLAQMSKALKRDMESIVGQNQARADGADNTPARKTRAMEHWIQTNRSTGSGYAAPGSGTATMTDGTPRAATEALLKSLLATCYTNGANPSLLVMGPAQKQTFSSFTGRSASQVRVEADKIVAGVDYYLSDFGELKAVPSRFVRNRTILALDPEYAAMAYLRPFQTVDLAVTGDAESKLLLVEAGLEMRNEAAHGKLADLS